jgi:DNA anti-recombination protein RmuC
MWSEAVLIVVIATIGVVAVAVIFRRGPGASSGGGSIPAIDAETLLQPVREQIAMIAGRLDKLVTESVTTRTEISGKIATAIEESRAVFDQGAELRDTTIRISTALQGTGQRGSWGQVQLRRVVELAGLQEVCERAPILLEHLAGVQAGLAAAVDGYNAAVSSANSRLLVSVRKMRELGVRVEKSTNDLKEAPAGLSSPPARTS